MIAEEGIARFSLTLLLLNLKSNWTQAGHGLLSLAHGTTFWTCQLDSQVLMSILSSQRDYLVNPVLGRPWLDEFQVFGTSTAGRGSSIVSLILSFHRW